MRQAVSLCRLAMTAIGCALATAFVNAAYARDLEMGGDNDYPYSIMAPEPGAATHHRMAPRRSRHLGTRQRRVAPIAGQNERRSFSSARGSSGSVLPTPLPRTPLIAPEGGGTLTTHAFPQQQGPTVVPGLANPVPNLPHGPETFQDRASRCAFQSGLAGVPGTLNNQYIGGCVQ